MSRLMLLAGSLLLLAALPVGSAYAANPGYWVTYQIDVSVNIPPATTWSQWYSGPFGVSLGSSTGIAFTDQSITDPTKPNCFAFNVLPESSQGLTSMLQKIVATQYRGDKLCAPLDPNQVQTLGSAEMTVDQNQSSTFQFPYLGDRQIQIVLSQTWVGQ